MTHHATAEQLSLYLDGMLDAAEASALEAHLAACAACRAELWALESTTRLVRALELPDPPPDFAAQVARRVAALRELGAAPDPAGAGGAPAAGGRRWGTGSWGRLQPAAAAVWRLASFGWLRPPVRFAAAGFAVLLLAYAVMGPMLSAPGAMNLEAQLAQDAPAAGAPAGIAAITPEAPPAPEGASAGAAGPEQSLERAAADVDSKSAGLSGASRLAPDALGPRIIKTGSLRMEVTDFDAAWTQVRAIASAAGGFIEESSMWVNEGVRPGKGGEPRPLVGEAKPAPTQKAGFLRLRVPADAFEATIDRLEELGEVKGRQLGSQDVAQQMIDLDARLEALRAQERRYLAILAEAKTVAEILQVEEYLLRVRTEIETLTGQLQYLERAVSYATITVELFEPVPEPDEPPSGWGRLWWRIRQAFLNSVQAVARFLEGFVVFLASAAPVLGAVGLAGWAGWAGWRRVQARRRTAAGGGA